VLQALFEAQQKYGKVTDETTQAILDQAEQQGLVGDHMKDVNKQILEVLIAIADVFGAKIPDAMRATRDAATETAAGIEREFSNIKIAPITVDVEGRFSVEDFAGISGGFKAFASGGIVRRPTLALVGEAGPEAVIPLSQLGSVAPNSGESTVIFEVDGKRIASATVPYLPGEIRRYVPA
jgi:phage-related minor tail protein